jgi:hypothetical protein
VLARRQLAGLELRIAEKSRLRENMKPNYKSMNMIQLSEPPKDWQSCVKLPNGEPTPDWLQNLRDLLDQGTAIEIEVCRFETINQIEQTLVELRYNVMFIQLPNETAFARFFLKKRKSESNARLTTHIGENLLSG